MMRALVTGAAGFIGSNLVDRLLADGHQVVGVDNLSTGVATNLDDARAHSAITGASFELSILDVTSAEFVELVAATAPDAVYHLAAQVDLRASVLDPRHDASCNVLGTINVLEACRLSGVRKIVYAASGGSRYGAPLELPVKEKTRPDPLSPYAAAKYAGEIYLRAYSDMYGIAPINLALANVYGPRQNPHGEAGVIAVFGSRMLCGAEVTIFGDGTATRDYVFVADVVEAFVRAGRAPVTTVGTYNIGTGQQTTTAEVHRLIAAAVGGAPPPRHAPGKTGEVHAIALDVSKAEKELGWKPRVQIAAGIRETVCWLRGAVDLEPAELAKA